MKKVFLAFCLLLTSCSLDLSSPPTQGIQESYPPLLEAFESNEQCPNICWLGIHPGTTTAEQAILAIRNLEQFSEEFIEQTDRNIQAYWFTENTKTLGSHVTVNFSDKGIVESLSMGPLTPFTVGDFVNLLGEPDEISLSVKEDLVTSP